MADGLLLQFGCTTILAAVVVEYTHGLGQHWEQIGLDSLPPFLETLYVVEIVYIATLASLKFSILAFYWRTIQTPAIHRPIYITCALVAAWMLASVGRPSRMHAAR
jgi:hypothetical protein